MNSIKLNPYLVKRCISIILWLAGSSQLAVETEYIDLNSFIGRKDEYLQQLLENLELIKRSERSLPCISIYYINNYLPVLEEHYQLVQTIELHSFPFEIIKYLHFFYFN